MASSPVKKVDLYFKGSLSFPYCWTHFIFHATKATCLKEKCPPPNQESEHLAFSWVSEGYEPLRWWSPAGESGLLGQGLEVLQLHPTSAYFHSLGIQSKQEPSLPTTGFVPSVRLNSKVKHLPSLVFRY